MKWSEYTIQKLTKESKRYPKNLLDLKDAPKQIFYRGELNPNLFTKSIAIVGSRRMTRYGATVIDKFVSAFVSNGMTTISGYMYGVDTEVHTKTVEYGGKTVAVMGGGIDRPYPAENDKLYTKILQTGGVVLSEYKPEQKPHIWAYPQRNRIIAALATVGALVIEAGEKSGSLITVEYARKLKKKIFAVSGPITSAVSTGTNYLIKKGIGKLVTGPEDIIGKMTPLCSAKGGTTLGASGLIGLEKEIYKLLENEEMSVDEIVISLGKDMVEINTSVSMLALRGVISEAGGKYFVV